MADGAMDRAETGYQADHMLENIGAAEVRFTANELNQFHTELSRIEIKGERLPKVVLDFSNVEAAIKKTVTLK